MKSHNNSIRLSAPDLANHLESQMVARSFSLAGMDEIPLYQMDDGYTRVEFAL